MAYGYSLHGIRLQPAWHTVTASHGIPFEVQVSWWLEQLNLYFTVLFTLELMLKVVAHGLAFNGKTSFLKVNNVRKQVVRT